jgi:hypothetical protein
MPPRIEASLIDPYFLVFLFPLGIYLLALATINRRERPLMISGTWDALMLSFGLSGLLLWVGPALLGAFYERGLLPGAADKTNRQFEQIWELYPWVWVSYYILVLCGQSLMVISRRDKTSVYNVDADALANLVARIIAEKGYQISQDGGLIVFEKAADPFVSEAGVVDVESFPALRHATLSWQVGDPRLRRTVDAEVNARLTDAMTGENPSVSWLLGISGVIFLLVFVGALYFIFAGLRPRGM